MTNNPARSIFFAGYLSYYVFSLCFLSKTYFSVFVSIKSYVSAKVEILLWIYHLSRSLDVNFFDLFVKIFLNDAFLFSEFFLRFPTFYGHFYDKVNFIFGASRWRTLIFVLLLTSGVTILYSTISAHLFCVNSFLSFS